MNIYEKIGPTHNNQKGSGGPKKGGRLKSPLRENISVSVISEVFLIQCIATILRPFLPEINIPPE